MRDIETLSDSERLRLIQEARDALEAILKHGDARTLMSVHIALSWAQVTVQALLSNHLVMEH